MRVTGGNCCAFTGSNGITSSMKPTARVQFERIRFLVWAALARQGNLGPREETVERPSRSNYDPVRRWCIDARFSGQGRWLIMRCAQNVPVYKIRIPVCFGVFGKTVFVESQHGHVALLARACGRFSL